MYLELTDNNSGKLQPKFSLLVQVSGKFELEGAIFELCRGTGMIEVPKHKSNEGELLTPPGTPLFPSSEGSESKPTSVAPRSSSLARSTFTTKVVSRISVSQSESYPSPRVRPPPQQVNPPDFPLDTPPNLRTTSQERPLSAGRSRTGVSSAMKGNPETMGSVNASRRHSSPIVTRGRLTEPSGKGRVHSNGHVADTPEPQIAPGLGGLYLRHFLKSPKVTNDFSFINILVV
ncbi:GASTRIC MUCIN-LIKE PROTEIN [Salix koriyanagi]|uniref:GASTRIC MUCIN-LIKE PROTEIN n=1 Tax=Salix koriyanagi TaxID=2511006 RepID=A0A9Q0ZTY8_9ROSI|nr:GASTRIC MUCIN-LIKE PROTEIN [Salix koriyanagi]